MAKKTPSIKGLFDRTTQSEAAQDDDIVKARGVGLKISEWQELENIAGDLGVTLHAVSVYAMRYFVKQYKAGNIKAEKRTTHSLPEL
jgi:hypothetical protein